MFTTAIALEALAAVGVPAYFDEEEGLLVAHPADVPQRKALSGEHVVLSPLDLTGRGYRAAAWVPDGAPDFAETATVYETPGSDAAQCARAVAEWFTTPRPNAGAVLLAALAEWGITAHSDDVGMSYAIPLDPATPAADVRDRPHLSVGDRNPSVGHVPAAHTGWTVFLHDEFGEPVGDPLFISGYSGPVDCATDSAAAAEAITDYLTCPTR
ncbi:hypothetical protein ACIRPT_20990 [Streptomyces sp. NPDC101227]|uniref:hypothetical protein n=1 Tax=Streptomyces sp. NPDC101227 TaxID=3366136 RepID=UPI00380958E7